MIEPLRVCERIDRLDGRTRFASSALQYTDITRSFPSYRNPTW
jgi:hypothetical protein